MTVPTPARSKPVAQWPDLAIRLLFWLLALVPAAWMEAAASQALIVRSDDSPVYREVVAELRRGLANGPGEGIEIAELAAAGLSTEALSAVPENGLVVTVGLAAAKSVALRSEGLPSPPRTLCLLIPRQAFDELAPRPWQGASRRITALYIDQPLARQVALLRIALPDRRRVGVILGPDSSIWRGELEAQARGAGIELAHAEIAEPAQMYGALQDLLPRIDVMLMLPDRVASDPDTAYGLMLTSYRAQVPLIGFSAGLAKAGALLSLYSTAQQQGIQGAAIARAALVGGDELPAPQHPALFTVRVNTHVARSLGLSLPDDTTLARALDAAVPTATEDGTATAAGADPQGDLP